MTEIPIAVRGDVEPRAVDQLRRCAQAGDAVAAALCADATSATLSRSAACSPTRHVSPSGVGYDIACGNKAVRTDLLADDVRADLAARSWTTFFARISFGVGRNNAERVDHPVLYAICEALVRARSARCATWRRNQLGTVGTGNHYVDLFAGDDGFVWIGVHFGSRGFGHKTASGFLRSPPAGSSSDRATDGEMDAPPMLFARRLRRSVRATSPR